MSTFLAKLRCLLPRGEFARHVVVLAGGTALGQVVMILASPILTRLYSPEDFGILAVYSSLLGLLSVVASLRFDLAIPLPELEEEAMSLLAVSFLNVMFITSLTALSVILLGDRISVLMNAPSLRAYLWLLPIGLFIAGGYQILNYWAIRERAFAHIARAKFTQSVVWVITQVTVGFLAPGAAGLLLGQSVGQGASIIMLARLVEFGPGRIQWSSIWQVARRYLGFSSLLSFSAVLNAASTLLAPILLNILYGSTVAGWFYLAQQSIGLPMALIRRSLAQVYFGETRILKQGGIDFWRTRFVKLGVTTFGIGALPAVIAVLFSPFVFGWVFGDQWKTAGLYASFLAVMFWVDLVSYPLGQTLVMLERQGLQLAWDIARSSLTLGSIAVARFWGLSHMHAVLMYSASMTLMYTILIILSYYTIGKWREV